MSGRLQIYPAALDWSHGCQRQGLPFPSARSFILVGKRSAELKRTESCDLSGLLLSSGKEIVTCRALTSLVALAKVLHKDHLCHLG